MLRFGAVSNSKSSNGRKIARMARNLTIFGPNRSRRRELKFEKKSKKRANEQTNELYKILSKFFGFFLFVLFVWCVCSLAHSFETFRKIVRVDAINLVRKSSNFEPSSRFFGRLQNSTIDAIMGRPPLLPHFAIVFSSLS